MLLHLGLILLTLAPDTVRLDPTEALARVLDGSPRVEAALAARNAGVARAGQARAWSNPSLSVTVENLGAARAVTGLPSPEGLEGQATLGFRLPVGGDRSSRIRQADALSRAAGADAAYVRGDAVVAAVVAVAAAQRDWALAEHADREAQTLRRLADALTLQADEGRASEGDAARVRLAAILADGAAADARATAAGSMAELARRLGYAPTDAVEIASVGCSLPSVPDAVGLPPELEAARSREDAARAGVALSRAARIPDLEPQLGFRRAAGTEALYVGLGFQLPLFDRGSRSVDAANADLASVQADLRATVEETESRRVATRRAMEALEGAGARFREGWVEDLARIVEATEARYDLGEGTLVELLDGRRARFEALAARERWRAEWRTRRAQLLRLSGVAAIPDFFCDPLADLD